MSFFHKMKKAVVGKKEEAGSVSLCPDYDAVRVEFESLHDVMLRIRQHLLTYREANSRLWTSATSLSTEFANMLEASASSEEHPYTAMAATMKASHAQLPTERERLDTMLNACLFPLKEQLAKYEELKVRMAEHDKQKDEVVYYQGKVAGLRTAREQSKKAESAADKDKYERNVRKMMDQEAAFQSTDTLLTAELRYAFEHRVAVLGPIMLAFVCAEKQMAASYTHAINDVKLVDVNEANTWLAKHEAAMAAKAVHVQTITTNKVVVTDLQSPTSPTVTVNTHEHKASTAPNVSAARPNVVATTMTTAGVMVSEPHYANGTGSVSASRAASQLQSPTGQASANFFDAFEPNLGSSSSASTSSAPFSDPFASTSPTATSAADTHHSTAADGVPYTIGSATSHYASSLASTHTAPPPYTAATAATSTPAVNGTTSSFPIQDSLLDSATTTSTVTATPALGLDDVALDKTHGVGQPDAMHGATGGLGGSGHAGEKLEKSDVEDASTFGVGEKTDMFAPTTAASHTV